MFRLGNASKGLRSLLLDRDMDVPYNSKDWGDEDGIEATDIVEDRVAEEGSPNRGEGKVEIA